MMYRFVPRGGEPGYPQDRKVYASWHKPIVVLCNQNSFSNAEIFSHAVKTLKRGKVVGVPTAGAVISTGGTSVMEQTLSQMFWKKVEPGDALQISGVVRVGGYGGELYRSFLISPWTEWQEHVWNVHTRCYEIQAEETYAGNTCSNVAKAVHDYQVENGTKHLIYHRPGHGEGMEGHQPPYQALGDYTVMREGMHFSNEPGLYDPENGFGVNHSNNILVSQETGLQMGTTPATREWCFLEL